MALIVDYTHLPAGPVSIAWFCGLYALAVWSSFLWFVIGVVFFAGSNFATLIGGTSSDVQTIGPFTVVGIAVMILLRMIVGCESVGYVWLSVSATLPRVKPSWTSAPGSRANCTMRSPTTCP